MKLIKLKKLSELKLIRNGLARRESPSSAVVGTFDDWFADGHGSTSVGDSESIVPKKMATGTFTYNS